MLLVDNLNQDSTILKKLRYCLLQFYLKSKFCQNCFSSSYYPLNSIKIYILINNAKAVSYLKNNFISCDNFQNEEQIVIFEKMISK